MILPFQNLFGKQILDVKKVFTHLKNLFRYCRLQDDQENKPLCPAKVGDIMFPTDFLHTLPSPSWTIPKLWKTRLSLIQYRREYNRG